MSLRPPPPSPPPPEPPRRLKPAEVLHLDPKLLVRRLRFLSARAKWHEQLVANAVREEVGSLDMHSACAATLRRDAGAIALILGQVDEARREFRRAGSYWLNLGFYEGLLLLRLGRVETSTRDNFLSSIPGWIGRSLEHIREPTEHEPRFASAALRSPRQLVSLIQAGNDSGSILASLNVQALQRLQIYRGYPLGVTQTPVARYLELLEGVRREKLSADHFKTLVGMSIRRSELISAAQEDNYHWRMALKPNDLIDIDILAIGLAALEHGEGFFAHVRSFASRWGSTAQLPFDLAEVLGLPPKPEPDPEPAPEPDPEPELGPESESDSEPTSDPKPSFSRRF